MEGRKNRCRIKNRHTFEEKFVSVPEQGGGKLIPDGMCNPGQIYTVSRGKSGMIGVFRLESQMLPGSGKFERTGLGSDRDCKESTNTAFNFLKANGKRISGGISTASKDYIINYQDLQGIGMTGKLALPTLIALCSIALGRPTVSTLAVLGEISISGTILKVDELANSLQVCLDSGAKKVLLSITSAVDLGTVPPELVGSFNLIFYSSAEDAVFKALGVEQRKACSMKTNDRKITDLMSTIHTGKTQLPDFQRGWVWDDGRIKALIASITNGYPVGAAMFLEYGNESIHFKSRVVEGAPSADKVTPDELILDGQQRLTSVYSSLFSEKAVRTRTDKGQEIERFYYIDMVKAVNSTIDRVDSIVSVPKDRKITSDFGRKIELDLSSVSQEYAQNMFPLNIILDPSKYSKWQMDYMQYHQYDPNAAKLYMDFLSKVIVPLGQYTIPVITLDKDTPKEAVCQVFENVNTGGVSLTVFELVTAIFAMDNFELRKDWEERKNKYFNDEILLVTSATDFLTACTLLSSYKKGGTVSCKKKDVLNLTLAEYQRYADDLTDGFVEAEKILQEERIFSSKDLPYTTQLIPLAVLCTLLAEHNRIKTTSVKDKIKQWYWCGVFGEMYGSANETRYVYDVVGVMAWLEDASKTPKTVQEFYFNPVRLLSLQSRLSAAYKGIMARILKNQCKDFISGREMDFTVYKAESIDIHHIFPRDYCEKKGLPRAKWNSVVNKTPITYSTNREIGGVAPSQYLTKIEKKGQVSPSVLDGYLRTHLIDTGDIRADRFDEFFIKRATAILNEIEKATGKSISGRDSDLVIQDFGGALL